MEEEEGFDNTSLYAVLNVAQDASDEDIKRSYRKLAQVFHPDKTSDALETTSDPNAAANFMRIQEAYEVLGNEEKRRVYDVYGEKGLQSGLEVGEYLRNPDEVRREYERLKEQAKNQRKEASVAHRGHYLFKIDACDCIPPYEDVIDHMPDLTSMATRNTVQLPLSDNTAASIGCQVAVRKRAGGGGSFVCGVRRNLTQYDVAEFQASVGLKQFAHLEFRRQLGQHTSAAVSTSYHPQAGLGFGLSTSRKLSDLYDADLMYQVGPESVMSFGLSRHGTKTYVSGRIELGMSTGVIFKAVWQATASMSLRMSAKFGTMGISMEVGANQKLTEFSSAGCGVVVGLQGVVLRPTLSRGGHVFEVPIMLSPTVQDYRVVAAAYILPPAISLIVKYWIVKPLKRQAKLKQVLSERAEKVKEVKAAMSVAQRAAKSLQPIAARKLRSEAQKNGLVILNAKYGTPNAIKQAELSERASDSEPSGTSNGPISEHAAAPPSRDQIDGSDSDEEFGQEIKQVLTKGASAIPEQWLDVTNAIRYMVNDGRLVLHRGYSKSNLMGFADVAIDEEKVLAIHFLYQKHPFSVTITDKGGLTLPGNQEQPIDDEGFKLFRKFIARESLGDVLFGRRKDDSSVQQNGTDSAPV